MVAKPVGLLLGSFNPIHNGHIHLAKQASLDGNFSEIYIVIHKLNRFKNQKDLADLELRARMAKLAVSNLKNTRVLTTNKPSLLAAAQDLEKKYPKKNFSLILSVELTKNIENWQDYDAIQSKYPIYVYENLKLKSNQILSAEVIRKKLSLRQSVQDYLPKSVINFISKNNLYK